MASTFTSLHFHIVFSTKFRKPWMESEWRKRLHEYLGGVVRGLDGAAETVDGTDDHVHLLVSLKPTHTLSDFVRDLKRDSSSWVHEKIGLEEFAWQEGFAAFTVSPTACDDVRGYIDNQEEHHRVGSFREELEELLRRAGVDYDARYLD